MALRDDAIFVPPGTRLYAIVTQGTETHIWIAVARRSETYSEWRGTYICTYASGRVTLVTVDDNNPTDDEIIIRSEI